MWRMLGMQGDSTDYLFWAYDGIVIEDSIGTATSVIDSSNWSEIKENYDSIKDDIDFDCGE